MTQMVTRCPKCATAFRITSTQLESAKGAVRCGSCLHIFKAQDYLVKSTTPEKGTTGDPSSQITQVETTKIQAVNTESVNIALPQAEQFVPDSFQVTERVTEEVKVEKTSIDAASVLANPVLADAENSAPTTPLQAEPDTDKTEILDDEDDLLISDDMDEANEKAGYEFDGFIDINMHPKQTVSLFEREIRYEPPRDEELQDESWAEDLLDDDEETLHHLKKPLAPYPTPDSLALDSGLNYEADLPNYDTSQAESAHVETSAPYSGPVFSLVDDHNDDNREEPVFSEAFLNATRPVDNAIETAESSAFAAALFNQETVAEEKEEDKPNSKRPVKSSKMRAFDTSRAALLMNIMPAPVEFTAKRMRRWYQRRLWSTLAILMGILLFCQVVYFKFDYFSRVEPYRTAYLFACPLFGCEVPALVDTTQILATNLIVRNHPNVANALMVDAILINNAPFEQPFPDLILSFSKLDETPVATRRFSPKEYLAGELAGMQYIPERQPVHITLEIADPGPDAVNYSLSTH